MITINVTDLYAVKKHLFIKGSNVQLLSVTSLNLKSVVLVTVQYRRRAIVNRGKSRGLYDTLPSESTRRATMQI